MNQMDTTIERRNLLQVITDRYENLEKKNILSRVFYAAEKAESRQSIRAFHERIIQNTHPKDLFGLLYESPDACVHILEAPTNELFDFLRELHRATQAQEVELKDIKILMYTDDIMKCSFPRWAAKEVNITHAIVKDDEPPHGVDYEEPKIENEINTMINKLRQIGAKVMGLAKIQMDVYLDSLLASHPELLPTNDQIRRLAQCEEGMTLTEFLNVYSKPVDVALESELVWPAPPPLKYI